MTAAAREAQRLGLLAVSQSDFIDNGDLPQGYALVLRSACEGLSVQRASIWRWDASREALTCHALLDQATGASEEKIRLSREAYPRFFQNLDRERAIAANDAHTDPATSEFSEAYLKPLGVGALLDVPIRRGSDMVGILCCEHVGGPREWTGDDIAYADALARAAGRAIAAQHARQVGERVDNTAGALSHARVPAEITGLKGLEVELEAREREAKAIRERLARITDNIPAAVYEFCVEDGRFWLSYASKGFAVTHGVPVEVALADFSKVTESVHPDDRPGWLESIARVTAAHQPWFYEYRVRQADGHYRWIRGQSVPYEDTDVKAGVLRYFGYLVDIEHQKRLEVTLARAREEAELASRAKSTFLATMSHEIRTPMIGVIGMLEVLSHGKLDAEQRRAVGMIRQSADALLHIIGDVLDLSKIEADKLELVPSTVSLRKLVEGTAHAFMLAASSKGLRLTFDVDPRLAAAHIADPIRIRQVLNNFLSNALKFTHTGSIELTARLRSEASSAARQSVTFSVKDTGIGVSAKAQAELFQPFTQAESSTTRRYGGSGLGLVICKRLAQMMGGEVTMQSKEGEGTTLNFTVPLTVGDASSAAQPPALDPDTPLVTRKKPSRAKAVAEGSLLLLVEDHPVNRHVLVRQLDLAGFVVDVARDGREGLEKFKRGKYGLVFTDLHMPEMDGLSLARAIRAYEHDKHLIRTPVLALTAAAMQEEARKAREAGMDDFVIKPPTIQLLTAKLQQWLPHLLWQHGGAPVRAPKAAKGKGSAVLDRAVLRALARGDEAATRGILKEFIDVTADDLSRLAVALRQKNGREVAREAHRIKGASRLVGASKLAEGAEQLERVAGTGNWKAILAAGRMLRAEFRALERHLKKN